MLFIIVNTTNTRTMGYKDITPQEFKELSTQNGFKIIDVRAEKEYEEGQIPNHILIDYFHPDFKAHIQNQLDPQANYLVYCRSGIRSGKACEIMIELGFTGELYNLEGGIRAWNESFS